jgi:hypothetical protein
MRWRIVSLSACSALLVAGCGSPKAPSRPSRAGGLSPAALRANAAKRLPVLTSLRLARLADQVAAGGSCGGAPLVAAAIAAVNRGEVPGALQEQLLADANRVEATCSRTAARALARRLRP